MVYALLPPDRCVTDVAPENGKVGYGEEGLRGVRRCAPRQIRGGMERFLDQGGELRLFFPDCLPLAAPFILFRLKRQGFSGCYVRSAERGLYVAARR